MGIAPFTFSFIIVLGYFIASLYSVLPDNAIHIIC